MAIEDALQLAADLSRSVDRAAAEGTGRGGVAVCKTLKHYQSERIVRTGAIHGMAGAAAFMASTYKVCVGGVRVGGGGSAAGWLPSGLPRPVPCSWAAATGNSEVDKR